MEPATPATTNSSDDASSFASSVFAEMNAIPTEVKAAPSVGESVPESISEPVPEGVPEGVESIESVKPAKPAEPMKPAEPTEPVQPSQPPAKTENELLHERIGVLQAELNRVSAGLAAGPAIQGALESQSPFTYVATDEEIPELLTSAKGVNELMSRVERRALSCVPDLVIPIAQEAMKQAVGISMFWSRNSDLLPHADYLAGIAGQIQEANENASFDHIMSSAEAYVRGRLNLPRPGTAPPVQLGSSPPVSVQPVKAAAPRASGAIPPTSVTRIPPPIKLEGIQKELKDLDVAFLGG